MKEIIVQKVIRPGEEVDALDGTLTAQFTFYKGMTVSHGKNLVRALADDAAVEKDISDLRSAIQTFDPATRTSEQQARSANIAAIKASAQNAVGVALGDLTAAQVKALLAAMLWKLNAVDKDGKVRSLSEWVG